jgi:uncharacterized protein (DUF983 family)
MRKYKEMTSTHTYDSVVERVCDLCGHTVSGEEWEDSPSYDIDETEIRHKEGSSCPDGGSGVECIIDLCPRCFKAKLVPWLKEQGVVVKYKEWDW